MKKMIILAMLTLMFVACSDSKNIDGVEYETYGFINKEDVKADSIKYKVCVGNVVWGAITFTTVIGPIYFFGFDLWEPDYKK